MQRMSVVPFMWLNYLSSNVSAIASYTFNKDINCKLHFVSCNY